MHILTEGINIHPHSQLMWIMYLNILILDISKYSNPNREKGSLFQIQMKDYFTKMTFVGFVSSVQCQQWKKRNKF